jgi:MFS family permease
LSVAGDQLARVALTLLVFDRTRSPLLAAVTFAASIVPMFVGGLTLSGLADRLPRREIMIVCDLVRAALVVVMAIPGVGVGVLIGLLVLVTMTSAPFTSARAALYPDILSGDRYVLGTAVTLTTIQFAQVIGFAAGGAAVGLFGVRTSLLVDAGTFLASALITRIWVRARPRARTGTLTHRASPWGIVAGLRLVFADSALRTPMLFGWLAAFYNVPEGVCAPLAASLGGGAVTVGLILAAAALGASVGALSFSRLVSPVKRRRSMAPLAAAACAVLALFVFHPSLPSVLAILLVSGLFDCYQTSANSAFVSATPPSQRSQAFGIAQGGMSLGQGSAMVLAGAASQHFPPNLVIAASGAIGAVLAVVIGFSHTRARLHARRPGWKCRGGGYPQVVVRTVGAPLRVVGWLGWWVSPRWWCARWVLLSGLWGGWVGGLAPGGGAHGGCSFPGRGVAGLVG